MELLVLQLIFLVISLAYGFWHYFCAKFNLFRAQGVPGPRPIPVFGTWWRSWAQNPLQVALNHYERYGKIYCTFWGRRPVLHIADVGLLRSILVKDSFEHFAQRNRRPVTLESEYLNKTMSMLHGDQWKVLRNLAMASFAKPVIEERVGFANESLLEFVEQWRKLADFEEGGKIDLRVETEILCEEVMANYSVGLKLGTVGRPDHPFVLNARRAMERSDGSFVGTVMLLYPKLLQLVNRLTPAPVLDTGNEYFVKLSKQILLERGAGGHHHTTREPDLVDRFLTCLSGEDIKGHQHINETIAVGQIASTILSGYDMGTVLTRVLHCLTMHAQVQQRCRLEILEQLDKFGGEIDYEMLMGLPYLEQCIREALRLYPNIISVTRLCTKDKEYPELGLWIPKGTTIECQMYFVQRDPELYPEPLGFDPDRFSPAADAKSRDPFAFLAFGQGPRGCFAQRFSMLVLKHCLVHVLTEFELYPLPETKDPIQLITGPSGALTAKDMFVGIRKLNSKPSGALALRRKSSFG